jgi:hypothetical protein
MRETWDQRYSATEYVYGKIPNAFFKSFIDAEKPGVLLLPAEGEGRNDASVQCCAAGNRPERNGSIGSRSDGFDAINYESGFGKCCNRNSTKA